MAGDGRKRTVIAYPKKKSGPADGRKKRTMGQNRQSTSRNYKTKVKESTRKPVEKYYSSR